MLCELCEASSTLGHWDGPGQCNSLLMSGSRQRSNQCLLKGHKSESFYLPLDPCTFDCSSYLSLHRQHPVPACHPHLVLGSLLGRFLSGVVESTELAENRSLLSSLVKTQPLLFAYQRVSYASTGGAEATGDGSPVSVTFLYWRGDSLPCPAEDL